MKDAAAAWKAIEATITPAAPVEHALQLAIDMYLVQNNIRPVIYLDYIAAYPSKLLNRMVKLVYIDDDIMLLVHTTVSWADRQSPILIAVDSAIPSPRIASVSAIAAFQAQYTHLTHLIAVCLTEQNSVLYINFRPAQNEQYTSLVGALIGYPIVYILERAFLPPHRILPGNCLQHAQLLVHSMDIDAVQVVRFTYPESLQDECGSVSEMYLHDMKQRLGDDGLSARVSATSTVMDHVVL